MNNRFRNKKSIFSYFPRIRLIYIFCPVILLIFMLGLSSIEETAVDKQRESLETALTRAITHCYAVEGYYPPSLAYLEDNYGLTYNKDLFFVDYQPVASNMRPNVTIILRKGSS